MAVDSSGAAAARATPAGDGAGLAELPEGPYLVIAMQLDAVSLSRADATCRFVQAMNRASIGPWRALGARAFAGLELDGEGTFEAEEVRGAGRKFQRVDWKGRYCRFRAEVPSFRAPFVGSEILCVDTEDEVAYSRCRLRTDLLAGAAAAYLEIEVVSNPDNLSLAVVDFEGGGRSSVTFSPDTGAVIRERKIQEAPRKVEGAYVQPLPTTPPGAHFEGCIGVYLRGGQLAFFRKCAIRPAESEEAGESGDVVESPPEVGPWECTGFITDLDWAEGRKLTPCIAFRDPGAYHVRLARIGAQPPFEPAVPAAGSPAVAWQLLDWEAEQEVPEDE